jgi:Putative DNA-binding domain
MSTLAAQQQTLLAALFQLPTENATKNIAYYAQHMGARGLKAYQANGHALAERVLQAAYPVVAQLLGDESMADLARALWHAHPPSCGDMAQWGGALPEFVRNNDQLRDEPYLADVAAAEWALHRCATAPDALSGAAPDVASFALLAEQDPGALTLRLAPGVALVCSVWPVADIIAAHQASLQPAHSHQPTLAEVGQKLRDQVSQDALVWRQHLAPCLREAQPGEATLLSALLAGQSLGDALEASPVLDFGVWFPQAVQTGLVLGAALCVVPLAAVHAPEATTLSF